MGTKVILTVLTTINTLLNKHMSLWWVGDTDQESPCQTGVSNSFLLLLTRTLLESPINILTRTKALSKARRIIELASSRKKRMHFMQVSIERRSRGLVPHRAQNFPPQTYLLARVRVTYLVLTELTSRLLNLPRARKLKT